MNDSHIQKDCWDKCSIIANCFAAVCVPIIIVVCGLLINTNLKEKETNVKYVEIAVDILSEKPNPDSKSPLREWAIDVLKVYSPVDITDEVESELRNYGLPRKKSHTEWDKNGVIER
jgi:hypothetical protein